MKRNSCYGNRKCILLKILIWSKIGKIRLISLIFEALCFLKMFLTFDVSFSLLSGSCNGSLELIFDRWSNLCNIWKAIINSNIEMTLISSAQHLKSYGQIIFQHITCWVSVCVIWYFVLSTVYHGSDTFLVNTFRDGLFI